MKIDTRKYKNVELHHHGKLHCIAHCKDCDWKDEHYMEAAAEANKHTKETGHVVSVENGNHYSVHPKNPV